MKKPRKLREGDRIQIVTSASPVRSEMFEQGVSVVRNLGFQVQHGDTFQKWRYLAGTDEHRLSLLQAALNDADTRAIFFARGGYGSQRLLRNPLKVPTAAKALLGCSDITSLHQYFQRNHGWVVFHGPMPSGDFARGQLHLPSFRHALMESDPYVLDPESVQTLQPGAASGMLTGGNLTMLQSTLGTAFEPDWKDAIVFLEDVAVKPYQIDRMLTQLKTAGKFDSVRAVIFGEMKDCIQVENQGYTLQEVLLELLGELKVPLFFNFPSGHVSGLNWTIPLGVRANVGSEPAFHLEILEGAVE